MTGEVQTALSLSNLAGKALSGPNSNTNAGRDNDSSPTSPAADSFSDSLNRAQRERQPQPSSATPSSAPKPSPSDKPAAQGSAAQAPADGKVAKAPTNPEQTKRTTSAKEDASAASNGRVDPRQAAADRIRMARLASNASSEANGDDVDATKPLRHASKAGKTDAPDMSLAAALPGLAAAAAPATDPAIAANAANTTTIDVLAAKAEASSGDKIFTDDDDTDRTLTVSVGDGASATSDRGAASNDIGRDLSNLARSLSHQGSNAPPGTSPAQASSTAAANTSSTGTFAAALNAEGARAGTSAASDLGAASNNIGQDLSNLARSLGLQGINAQPGTMPTQATAQVQLATPVPDPKFSRALGEQVSLFVAGDIKSANILVSPPNMGPIRIELTVSGEETKIVFTATHPDTRLAIEQSSGVLKTMLAERGVNLGQLDVGQGNPQQQAFAQPGGSHNSGQRGPDGQWTPAGVDRQALTAATNAAIEQAASRRNIGLLDLFA